MTTLVYPYMQQLASSGDDELLYSIRSMCANLKFEFDIVLVGDKPAWYQGQHIYTQPIRGVQFTRAFDIARKLQHIIESDLITEDFIYCYDDIYAVAPISGSYFDSIVAQAESIKIKLNGSGKWNRMMQATFDIMKIATEKYSYETHLPRKLNKTKLHKITSHYNLNWNPLLFNTLYFNEYFDSPDIIIGRENNIKAEVYQKTSLKDIQQKCAGKLWLNHGQNGWNASLKRFLIEAFPSKCRYEK